MKRVHLHNRNQTALPAAVRQQTRSIHAYQSLGSCRRFQARQGHWSDDFFRIKWAARVNISVKKAGHTKHPALLYWCEAQLALWTMALVTPVSTFWLPIPFQYLDKRRNLIVIGELHLLVSFPRSPKILHTSFWRFRDGAQLIFHLVCWANHGFSLNFVLTRETEHTNREGPYHQHCNNSRYLRSCWYWLWYMLASCRIAQPLVASVGP